MELTDSMEVPVDRSTAWTMLNDPTVLKQCITGCTELERTADERFEAKLGMKIGPIKVSFSGAVSITEVDAPVSYVLVGEGKGGAAGFAKGIVSVSLSPSESGGTLVSYTARVDVGGKLAQIGSRLLDSTARRFAADFFDSFSALASSQLVGSGPNTSART
jgi:carbon monoxide dehydrogenase subunit G